MKKFLKWAIVVVVALVVILFGTFKFMQSRTKKASPEQTITYSSNGKVITIFYNRPSKRGREIFGGLVPYDTVWRTGANEASTFTSNAALEVEGKKLPAGKYTLWTIPGKDSWKVILNSKQYTWGIKFKGQASREAEADVLEVTVPVEKISDPVEIFTIKFPDKEKPTMVMEWDMTKISVPFK